MATNLLDCSSTICGCFQFRLFITLIRLTMSRWLWIFPNKYELDQAVPIDICVIRRVAVNAIFRGPFSNPFQQLKCKQTWALEPWNISSFSWFIDHGYMIITTSMLLTVACWLHPYFFHLPIIWIMCWNESMREAYHLSCLFQK